MVILEFPHDIAKKAGVSDISNRYVDQMGTIYDHMDRDLANMGNFTLNTDDLNGIDTVKKFDVLIAEKAMERGHYPSIWGLDDVMNRELYHGLVRVAKTAGNIACKEERQSGLEWALGSATCLVGIHVNYIDPFVKKFNAGYGVGKRKTAILEGIRDITRVEVERQGVHRRHFIHPDGDITDAQDEREKVADHVRSGNWYDRNHSALWPVHMIEVVDKIRADAKTLYEPAEQDPIATTPPGIMDRPLLPYKKIPKDVTDLHSLLGALVRGDHVIISGSNGKTTIELPTIPPEIAKQVVSIVAAHRSELDNLVARIQATATEHPEMATGDETSQALLYLSNNIKTMRIVSKGGRGSIRSWSSALQ